MSYISKFFITLLIITFVFPVYAQEEQTEENQLLQTSTPLNCFDWYKFGSVIVSVQSQGTEAVLPGTDITFSGSIKNTNMYPVPGARITAKVFRRDDETFMAGFQNEVVDVLEIDDSITLQANAERGVSFTWTVPLHAKGGQYYIAYYVTTDTGFPLAGLLYSDDVVAARSEFVVIDNTNSTVQFVKPDTEINGLPYTFSATETEVEGAEKIISTVLSNPTNELKTIPLQWNQYAGDSLSEKSLRNTKTELITLQPNEQKEVSYVIAEQRERRVLVTATLEDLGAKSILFTRFVQTNVPEVAIGFHTISSFPLQENVPVTLASCINTTLDGVSDGTVTMTIRDSSDAILHSYVYKGSFNGLDGGYGEHFTPTQNYNFLKLSTVVEKDGVVLASAETVYDCNMIDPNSCIGSTVSSGLSDFLMRHIVLVFTGLLALVVAACLGFLYLKKRMKRDNISIVSTTTSVLVFLFLGGVVATTDPLITTAMFYDVPVIDGGGDTGGSDTPPIYTPNGDTDLPPSDSTNGTVTQPTDPTQCPNVSVRAVWQGFGSTNDYFMYSGPGNAKGNRLFNNCPVNAPTATEIRDDNDSVRAITEDNYKGGDRQQLCLGTSDPAVEIISGWVEGSCPAGAVDVGVYDSDDSNYSNPSGKRYYHKHDFNEEDNKNNDIRWCLGVSSPDDKYEIVTRKVPGINSCAPDEANVFYVDDNRFNMNNEDNLIPTSVCVKVRPKAGVTCGMPLPLPTVDMTINGSAGPISAASGAPLTIAWTSADATSCTASASPANSFSGGRPTSGSENQTFGSTATTYTVTCSNATGASSDSVTVNLANPLVDLKINGSDGPLSVNRADVLNLSWTTANVSSCSLYGAGLPGGSVALAGNTSVSASVSDSYVLTCNGVSDTVAVSVVNRPPNPPSIAGPATAGGGVSNTFTFTGTDPDNDQIFYEVDWDNNGSIDVSLPGSGGFVASGAMQSANRSWPGSGTYTVQARTVDSSSSRSSWAQRTITITSSVPPTATLEASVQGSSWSTADQTINNTDSLALRWSSSNATGCSGSGGNFNPTGQNGSASVNRPAPNTSITFTVTCTGPGGNATDSLTVTTRQLPNLSQPSISYTPGSFNPTTKLYDSVTIVFQTNNNGGSDTTASASYNLEFDRGQDGYDQTVTGSLGTLTVGQTVSRTEAITGNIPLGNSRIRVTVDSTNAVLETDEADNQRTLDLVVAPPDPGLSVTVNPTQVQNGQNTTVSWTIANPYAMNCSVFGPGMTTRTFDPAVTSSSGTVSAGPLRAKSEYTFRCIEPSTGATFTDTATVETQGVIEEI